MVTELPLAMTFPVNADRLLSLSPESAGLSEVYSRILSTGNICSLFNVCWLSGPKVVANQRPRLMSNISEPRCHSTCTLAGTLSRGSSARSPLTTRYGWALVRVTKVRSRTVLPGCLAMTFRILPCGLALCESWTADWIITTSLCEVSTTRYKSRAHHTLIVSISTHHFHTTLTHIIITHHFHQHFTKTPLSTTFIKCLHQP